MPMRITQLGDYVLEKRVGSGGMGEVYRARQISLDRTVAVKVLPRSLASQPGFTERFQREARAAANLIHPNVIQVYSIGLDKGIPYFAMEYVEGEDLQLRMKRQRTFGFDEIVDIIFHTTSALSVAAEKGIVHRDIKPSNIMFDRAGNLKVMDFGLAKITTGNSNLTQSGLIMGTPNYMSPEQGKGEATDARSDIYSLGVVFYELLTGSLPFRADTPTALIYKHAYEKPPPPREKNPEVPPYLEYICLKMISKDPADRYATPKDLLKDLEEFRRDRTYYLSGGMPENKDQMEDQTIIDDPATATKGSATSSRTGMAAAVATGQPSRVQTAAFSTTQGSATGQQGSSTVAAQTVHSQTAAGAVTNATQAQTLLQQGQTLPPYQRPGSPIGWMIFTLLLVGLIIVAVIYKDQIIQWVNPPQQVASKVLLPLPELHALKAKVPGKVRIEWLPPNMITYADCPDVDREVEPGRYHFKIMRNGYVENDLWVALKNDGTLDPPFNDPRVKQKFEEWKPGDELREAYNQGIVAFNLRQWPKASEHFKRVLAIDEHYQDAEEKYDTSVRNGGVYDRLVSAARDKRNAADILYRNGNISQAKAAYEECRRLCMDDVIAADAAILEIKSDVDRRIGDLVRELDNLVKDRARADAMLARGEWDDAIAEFETVARKNADDVEARDRVALCREMKRKYQGILERKEFPQEDEATRAQLDEYLKTCTKHTAAQELLNMILVRIEGKTTLEQKIQRNMELIEQIMASPNPDWQRVKTLAEGVLKEVPEHAGAKTALDKANYSLNEAAISQVFVELGVGLMSPNEKEREDMYRRLVSDRNFEIEWKKFFGPEVSPQVKLLSTTFKVLPQDIRVEPSGNSAQVDNIFWEYQVRLNEFGKTLQATSKLKVSLSRESDTGAWKIKTIEGVPGSTTGTIKDE